MAILFDEPSRVFKLDTLHSSYVFAIEDSGYLVHLHYGGRIDDVAACRELYPHQTPAFHPYPAGSDPKFSRGHIPQEFSTNMAGDFRIASAVVRGARRLPDRRTALRRTPDLQRETRNSPDFPPAFPPPKRRPKRWRSPCATRPPESNTSSSTASSRTATRSPVRCGW